MVYPANILPVMIASPSDVDLHRDDARTIINNWNFANGFSRRLMLMPVGWETHAAPEMGSHPQELINSRLLSQCDLLVGIFWTKLGTPTGTHDSGTVEEITRHVEAGKPAMLYFSDAPVAPQSLNATEFERLTAFKKLCYERGLVANFTSAQQFRDLFSHQLTVQLNTNPYLSSILGNLSVDAAEKVAEMSDVAKELLVAAAEDAQGVVMSMRMSGGHFIQTNGKSFGETGNVRSAALWEAALNELISLTYLTARGHKGEVFQVTDAGYKRVDAIKAEVSE